MRYLKLIIISTLICIFCSVNAQSLSSVVKGVRMPQLDSLQITSISKIDTVRGKGQAVYNINSNCLEYWNGKRWVTLRFGDLQLRLMDDCNSVYSYNTPSVYNWEGINELCGNNATTTYTFSNVLSTDYHCPDGFKIYLIAGADYTNLTVAAPGSSIAFSIAFEKNYSSQDRVAVVRIVSTCSNEYQDFVFVQKGAPCAANMQSFNISVAPNDNNICDNNGAVIAYMQTPNTTDASLFWEYKGKIVHRGPYMEITQAGEYTVYACSPNNQSPAPKIINITKNSGSPESKSRQASELNITVSDSVCSGVSSVIAYNPEGESSPANQVWFEANDYNTAMVNGGQTYFYISDGSGSGLQNVQEVFVILTDSGICGSRMSNIVQIPPRRNVVPEFPAPEIMINGSAAAGAFCEGSEVELSVGNSNDYPAGTVFEFFDNAQSIGSTTDVLRHTFATDREHYITVNVSKDSRNCTQSSSIELKIVSVTPSTPMINGYSNIQNTPLEINLCDNTGDTILNALDGNNGNSYQYIDSCEWFLDGKKIEGKSSRSIVADLSGTYTVRWRYHIGGCWSEISSPVTVKKSAPPSIEWLQAPPDTVFYPCAFDYVYSILALPDFDSAIWATSSASSEKILNTQTFDNGKSVKLYYDLSLDIETLLPATVGISVYVNNVCGSASLQKDIVVVENNPAVSPAGLTVKTTGADGTFNLGDESVVFYAGTANCTPVSTIYEWYVNDVLQSGESSPYFTYSTPLIPGDYKISVKMYHKGVLKFESSADTVRVIQGHRNDLSNNYKLQGRNCLDVKRSNDNKDCLPHSQRTDDFQNTKTFTYLFTPKPTAPIYTDLTFRTDDPDNLLASAVTWNGDTATLVFRSDINSYLTGVTKADSKKIKLYAQYKAADTAKQIILEISVNDCYCGCEVKSTLPAGYLTFMCYNLGANPNINTVEAQTAYTPASNTDSTVYGGLFQWGRRADGHQIRTSAKVVGPLGDTALTNEGQVAEPYKGKFVTNASYSGWRSPDSDILLWGKPKTTGDPCPEGWRIPTNEEWLSIFEGNSNNIFGVSEKYLSNSGNFIQFYNSAGTKGLMISPDGGSNFTLFLPFTGLRDCTNANVSVSVTSGGYYWNSYSATTRNSLHIYDNNIIFGGRVRSYGHSVRCVKE